MSVKCFVDTNILIYALDPRAGEKQIRAVRLIRELWESRAGVISTQVLQELCVNARRRAATPISAREADVLVREYAAWEIHVNTLPSIYAALEVEEKHRVSFWDAMILQAATASGAEILYSEDLSDGQIYGTVRVVNPFKN